MIKRKIIPTIPANVAVFESTTKTEPCNQEDRLMVESELERAQGLHQAFVPVLYLVALVKNGNENLQFQSESVLQFP